MDGAEEIHEPVDDSRKPRAGGAEPLLDLRGAQRAVRDIEPDRVKLVPLRPKDLIGRFGIDIEVEFGVLVRLDQPVAYDSVDDRPVDVLFALFAPPSGGTEHLRALAAVSRALRSAELRERLRQARRWMR